MSAMREAVLDAVITFTVHRPERLAYIMAEMGGDEDAPEYHAWYADHRMTIRDGRPVADAFSLDREGFVLLKRPTAVADFYDEGFRGTYNPEVEALVKQQTGAARVVVFDHTIRVQSDDKRREKKVRETVKLAHNDYTEKSGPQRVRDILGDDAEAERRLARRYAFFNLWRPVVGPVLSVPLAMCDARSVAPQDWVIAELVYTDRVGEIYNLAWSEGQRWWYFPRMTIDEVLLFKCFDSARDGRSRFTPHSAFDDPTTPAGAPPRESIETRVVAFFED
jgi:hypothetical protein